jgi:predicted lipid-binding transport protein (Tim44 family)
MAYLPGAALMVVTEISMGGAKLPIDLILFGLIALFLVLRLRSILGRRTGFEGLPQMLGRGAPPPVIEGRAEPVPASPARALPDPAGATGQALAAMRAMDRKFDPGSFLSGAENAFRIIVGAFAAGDRGRLQPLLTPDTFAAFDAAMTAREKAGHTQRTEIRSVLEATIEQAALHGSLADITVRFVSHQITLTTAQDGTIVSGADAVTELADVWTFVRDLKQPQLAWKLASARSA